MVGFYSQQGVFESIKNVGNIRLALNMKAKKLVVAKTANNINWPSHTLICLMSHTLYFCATSFCRSLHELESKVKTCFKVRLPKKLLAQSGGTNSTIIFTNVLNESYSTLITDSLESTLPLLVRRLTFLNPLISNTKNSTVSLCCENRRTRGKLTPS